MLLTHSLWEKVAIFTNIFKNKFTINSLNEVNNKHKGIKREKDIRFNFTKSNKNKIDNKRYFSSSCLIKFNKSTTNKTNSSNVINTSENNLFYMI